MPGIFAAVIFLIVYGSLYPWELHAVPSSPVEVLLHATRLDLDRWGLRDIAVNLILYLPLGAAGAWTFARSRLGLAIPVLTGLAVSVGVELLQVYTPTRRPSLMDVVCNVAGAALGAIAVSWANLSEVRLGGSEVRLGGRIRDRGALALLAAGALSLLFPLFPVLGRSALYDKLRTLYHLPVFEPVVLASFAVMWFTAGRLGDAAFAARPPRWWPLAAVSLVAAQLLIVERLPLASELMGAVMGAVIFLFAGRFARSGYWLAWAFALVLLLRGLAPFHLQRAPQDFVWIPFGASLGAEWQSAMATLAEKLFWYGSAVWIFRDAGATWFRAALGTAQMLAIIEVIQVFVPGRTPEITDPVIALGMGAALWAMRARSV